MSIKTSFVALFIISVVMGFILSRMGRPLNTPIFTLHKMLGLASAVLGVMFFKATLKNASFIPAILSAIFVLCIFVTGGLLSFEKPINKFILYLHAFSPIAVGISIFWFFKSIATGG